MKYWIVLLSLLLSPLLLANGVQIECRPKDTLGGLIRKTPEGGIDIAPGIELEGNMFRIRRNRQMGEMLAGFKAFQQQKKEEIPQGETFVFIPKISAPKLTGKIELTEGCFLLFDISVLDIKVSEVIEDRSKSSDDPARITETPVEIPPGEDIAGVTVIALMENEINANSEGGGAQFRKTTQGEILEQILSLLEVAAVEGPEKDGKNVCFRQEIKGIIDFSQGYEAGGIDRSIHLKLNVFGFAKCCCPEVSPVQTTPISGPSDQPVTVPEEPLPPTDQIITPTPAPSGDQAAAPTAGGERTCKNFTITGATVVRAGERVKFEIKGNFVPSVKDMFSGFSGVNVFDQNGNFRGAFGGQIHNGEESVFGSTPAGEVAVTQTISADGMARSLDVPGSAVSSGDKATVIGGCIQQSGDDFVNKGLQDFVLAIP
ncbi:MAG: hypothetical protein AAB309_04210 [Deltaproteobacteria bacterium]